MNEIANDVESLDYHNRIETSEQVANKNVVKKAEILPAMDIKDYVVMVAAGYDTCCKKINNKLEC